MRINSLIAALLAALCLTACKTSDSRIEVIELAKLTPVTVKLSQFTTGMTVVPLETTDESLIGRINTFELSGNSIYIHDAVTNSFLVFDRTGKFLYKKNRQGRGPGEYVGVNGFIVDDEERTLEVLDTTNKKLITYSLPSFDLVSERPVQLSVFGFWKNDGMYYFITNGLRNVIDGEKTNSNVIALDPQTDKLTPLFDLVLPDDVYRSFSINGYSRNADGRMFFSRAWDNTLYEIDGLSATPIISIDAGNRDVPEHIKNGTYEQQEEFMNNGMSKDRYLFFRLSHYDDTDTIITFSNGLNPTQPRIYVSMGTDEFVADKIVLDLVGGSPEMNIHNTRTIGDTYVYGVSPAQEQSPQMAAFLSGLGVDREDNPVLMLFEIK